MSGFVAIVGRGGQPVDRALLERMTEHLAFRGPDAVRAWSDGHAGLGHALLRTTDESASEQQPCHLDGEAWIVADARLDDRRELIRELRARGRRVAEDAPDVELVLHAYRVWDEDCLDHLMGDFAFALWDARTRRLFCARDHFGIVPLYYADAESWLVVSNTLTCVQLHPDVSPDLDERAIGDILLTRMNHDPARTVFTDVRSLPPAHSLRGSVDGLHVRRYWAWPDEMPYVRRRVADSIEEFRERLDVAVADRLRTDRVALHLSGGLDSGSIAATASRLRARAGRPLELRAHTITCDRLLPDREGYFASMTAGALGLTTEHVAAEPFFMAEPREEPEYVPPEPSFVPDCFVEYDVLRRASRVARVQLQGYGGDPAFAQSAAYWANLLRRGRADRIVADVWRYWRLHGRRPPLYLRPVLNRWRRGGQTLPFPDWLDRGFTTRLDLGGRAAEMVATSPMYRGLRGMATSPLWPSIFRANDPGFTGIAMKARFPFFDLRLLRFVATVPPMPWLVDKWLLRASMSGRLPEAVRTRPKAPLAGHPFHRLLRERGASPWMVDVVSRTPELRRYVDAPRLLRLLRSPADISLVEAHLLHGTLALAYWLHHRHRDRARMHVGVGRDTPVTLAG